MSKLAGLESLDVPGWTGRVGGPSGRHARITRSLWYDPAPWAIVASVFTWLVLMVRQMPCWQRPSVPSPNLYSAMCYSDIPILYQNRDYLWGGGPVIGQDIRLLEPIYVGWQNGPPSQAPAYGPWFEYPPLTTAFVWLSRLLAKAFGAVVDPFANGTEIVQASQTFWSVNAALLAVCFGAVVWAHLQMGRNSGAAHTGGVRVRAWDAVYVAAAPVVMLSGLINWDLLAVALTSLGILLWARSRPWAAGAVIGLAAAAKFYPLAVVAVLLLLCLRAGRMKAWGQFVAAAVVAWAFVNVPLMVVQPEAWSYFWTFNAGRGPDLGSLWYVLSLMGLKVVNVSIAEVVCLVLSGGFIIGLTLSAPRRPRLGQVALLVMVAFLVFNKVYSPQYVLWLLPIVVLARPVMFDLLVFTVAESLYFFSVWGFLNGTLGLGSGQDRLYWLAVLLRVGVQVWLATRVVKDMWAPWQDPVRGPFVDDPIGGVLNHQPDVAWLVARPAARGDVDSQPVPRDGPMMARETAPGTIVVVATPRRRHRRLARAA